MADTSARASFLVVPRPTEEGEACSAAHTLRSRVLHARRTPRASQDQRAQPAQEPAFVFVTPGGPTGGQKAARSTKKKSAVKGRTPADDWPSPLEGSPMQWSPMDSQTAEAAEPVQHVSPQTQPAYGAATSTAEADHVAVELTTRLHLSELENLPHELESRLNLAHPQQGTKQPVATPAERVEKAPAQPPVSPGQPAAKQQVPRIEMEAAAAELASRFQEVRVAPTADQSARTEASAANLASQFEHLHMASSARQQQQQQPHPGGDAAVPEGQQAAPPAAPAVPTGFVFAAGAANSPVQRQGKAPGLARKGQAVKNTGTRPAKVSFAASSRPSDLSAAQPAVPTTAVPEANAAPMSSLHAQASTRQPLPGGWLAGAPSASQPSLPFSSGPSTANQCSQPDLGNGVSQQPQEQPQEQHEQQGKHQAHEAVPPPAAAPKLDPRGSQQPVDQGAPVAQAGPRPQPSAAFSFVAGTAVDARAPVEATRAPAFAFGSQSAGSSEGGPVSFIFGNGPGPAAPEKAGGSKHQLAAPQPFASSGGLAARRALRKGASSSPASQGSRTGTAAAMQPEKQSNGETKQQATEALQKELSAAAFCETFRIQGNEAFKNLQYEEALEHYTKAMKALWPCPTLHPMLAPLYSNRAAALLSLGKPWQALQDCQSGLKCDPKFTRCALRIATCYSRLGDFAAAVRHLKDLQQSAGDAIVLAEVNSKLKEVAAYRDQVLKVLDLLGHPVSAGSGRPGAESSHKQGQAVGQRALEGGLAELELLRAHVPHAEYLQAARAQALLRLGRYPAAKAATEAHVHFDETKLPVAKHPWQSWLEAQCAFHEGEHANVVRLLRELTQHTKQAAAPAAAVPSSSSTQQNGPDSLLEAVVPLPSIPQVEEAIASAEAAQKHRQQGNELMKQHKFAEAVQKYSEALATPGLSAAFAAILYSNRAAAHQGLQQLAQAVADCCRSKALAPAYAKAHSRLAALLTVLRLHTAAVRSLEAALHTPSLTSTERCDYETRLREARAAAQRKPPGGSGQPQPDHYKLLGLERTCTIEDVRKAYKRLALHLHPDKVVSQCRYTAQLTEVGAVVLPAEEAQGRLQEDAKWLFQCLGEAHGVLQDKTKREDLDFELRMEERYGSSSSSYGDPYFGGFGFYGERHYGPGQPRGASGGGYSPGGRFAERVRRAAQQRQQGNGSRGFHGYGWG